LAASVASGLVTLASVATAQTNVDILHRYFPVKK
jgi:hypothetical protein